MSTSPQSVSHDSSFFLAIASLITLVVFGGFTLNWEVNPDNLSRVTLWIGLHGGFSAAWYLLLLNQLRLTRSGKIQSHMLWGKVSAILVLAIVISGAIMALDLYDRLSGFGIFNAEDPVARVRAGGLIGGTFLQWFIFAGLYILGVLNVKTPVHHKRFMLAAAIQMMPEGLNRIIHILEFPSYSMFVVISCIYLTMMIYDWRTDRRIHWSTALSIGLFALMTTCFYTVFRSQVWGDLVVSLLN